ncbi:zinc finger protein 600-like isoform X2 [Folsomia candida]|uniref:zinc finger protein 600-like isoform X2 n=1 Tax=Folsomia candida TaxID=158441 RepID=UPI0016053A5F|nr:zinc finger protein 600-like isoform X2 [Folsomia candida]
MDSKKTFECPTCSKTLSTKKNLKRHIVTHGAYTNVKCQICRKLFKNPAVLESHVTRSHSCQPKLVCSVCCKEYGTRQDLQRHFNAKHISTPRPRYPCKFPGCGKTYLEKSTATHHFQLEHVQNLVRFPCPLCEKEFKDKAYVAKHIAIHTTEKSHKCEICQKSFVEAVSLKNHKIHQEKSVRPVFACTFCLDSFLSYAGRRDHIQTYHKREKYPCSLCDKIFSSKSGLRQHKIAKHSKNEKDYHACNKCEYKSWLKSQITMHNRRKHGGLKSNKCYFCGNKFFKFSELVRHCCRRHTLEKC